MAAGEDVVTGVVVIFLVRVVACVSVSVTVVVVCWARTDCN